MTRRWMRSLGGPIVTGPRHGQPAEPAPAVADDVLRSPLPGWRFRGIVRAAGAPAALPVPAAIGPSRSAPARPVGDRIVPVQVVAPRPSASAGGPEFRADRGAARYAPAAAEFAVGDRMLPVQTVSMSGLSVFWDSGTLPAVGTEIEGLMHTGSSVGEFPATLRVLRLEPGRGLVAGRFGGLRGRAIDQLLNWLVQLERSDGG